MKKAYILVAAAAFLISCGGEDNSTDTDVNSGDQSSLVANTDPNTEVIVAEENSANSSEQVDDGERTTIEYFETTHNFGNVFYPSENLYTFKFKNTGKEPLIIESATASCGCTVPNKPEEPILPGEVGELDVIFRPKQGQVGQMVTKKITVKANTVPNETYLEISGNVMEGM